MTPDEVKAWLRNQDEWPTADSFDLDSLEPRPALAAREASLRDIAPGWFWQGEPGAELLTIGAGKGYFERKYWDRFNRVFVIDPSEKTRLSFDYFPVRNVSYLGGSLFDLSCRLGPVPKYGWLGASIHYVFGEFLGWGFMHKLAMMVSDTLLVDGGVFDADTPLGRHLLANWEDADPIDEYRRSQFSFACFQEAIRGLWRVEVERASGWIGEGRRTLVLKRILPPTIQRSQLELKELVAQRAGWAVYRCNEGYYKQSAGMSPMLVHDTVSKLMGWPEMVRFSVYDGDRFCGFVVHDYGEELPEAASVSEKLHLMLWNWLLPLGLMPADVARRNIRIRDGRPVWIDLEVAGLRELPARGALWVATNMYKDYPEVPDYARRRVPAAESTE
jgi:hypothetical protein